LTSSNSKKLVYPLGKVPDYGELLEIASDIYWTRIPLPGVLNHINIWLIRDGDKYVVVDTGMRSDKAVETWQKLLAELPGDLPIKRVLVTHFHPDHVGMAGWLIQRGVPEFWMTRMEYMTCRVSYNQIRADGVPEEYNAFNRSVGWPESAVQDYSRYYGAYKELIFRPPLSYCRIEEGQQHAIGENSWSVIIGNGHSPEHACFYSKSLKLLISGDQILPRISSNVSVTVMEPFSNPMADWLDSLKNLKATVPNDVLVMPAHQECFIGLHERVDQLITSQESTLAKLLESLRGEPKRAFDVFETLFFRPISTENFLTFNLATGEAVACLNCLYERGQITRIKDSEGVFWYKSA